jgi:DNA-directed RNA polymerase subunit M/transcription elongation factor TFIIS
MQAGSAILAPPHEKRDLFFNCDHCGTSLVVDSTAAGMTLNCQRCGQATSVPGSNVDQHSAGPKLNSPEELAELHRRLKENESQRTEISGYIKQLSIQLHRWQLRLQTLNERNQELTSEIGQIQSANRQSVPD